MSQIHQLKQQFSQLMRFALVGVSNSLVDIAMTNLLVYLFNPATVAALMGISLVACVTATVNSYCLNRSWTFRSSQAKSNFATMSRFLLIALLTIVVNTSIFLFLHSYLQRHFSVSNWVLINAAKIGAIGCSSIFSFFGYKIAVFDRERFKKFREQFRFSQASTDQLWMQVVAILGLALLVRVLYYLSFSASLALPAIAFSMVAGVLVLIPAMVMARQLFGPSVGLLTGLLCATHPRLIEFSCNGSVESFYLLCYSLGVMWFQQFVGGNILRMVGWACGIAFAVGVAIHPELILSMLLIMLGLYWCLLPKFVLRPGVEKFRFVLRTVLGFVVTTQIYLVVVDRFFPALQPYSLAGLIGHDSELVTGLSEHAFDMLRRLPGVLSTPIVLFAFLLPFLAHLPVGVNRGMLWALGVMMLFPLFFYPFFDIQPWSFLPMIVPVQIFGAAGLTAFCAYLNIRYAWPHTYPLMVGAVMVISVAVAVLRKVV